MNIQNISFQINIYQDIFLAEEITGMLVSSTTWYMNCFDNEINQLKWPEKKKKTLHVQYILFIEYVDFTVKTVYVSDSCCICGINTIHV